MKKLVTSVVLSLPGLLACNVEENADPTGGATSGDMVVVTSDYKSTNVAIVNLDGKTVSESFVSSGSTKPGLGLALSGDVTVPRLAPGSGQVVLLDRFGANVITWMDRETADVLGQLPVGSGFESNPQDYLEFASNRAVVSRFGSNPNPGQEKYDEGGDLLLLDTSAPKILGRIAMPEENAALLPRPAGLTELGGTVIVTLQRISADFDSIGEGRFVGVSPTEKKVLWTVDIEGVKNCGRIALSPSKELGAIACSSQYDSATFTYNPEQSDVVVFDMTVTPPKELRKLKLGKALSAGLQPTLEFATETKLLALTYGGNATPGDTAVTVDAETGDFEELLAIDAPYSLVSTLCAPPTGSKPGVCMVSDAALGKLRRYEVSAEGDFKRLSNVTVDTEIGLPPHALGAL